MARVLAGFTAAALIAIGMASADTSTVSAAGRSDHPRDYRASVIARAKVWQATDIPSVDFLAGPQIEKTPAIGQEIDCTYFKKKFSGHTPKFACHDQNGHDLKVKYGGDNGEVYGEVLGTRLLWALGFGADRMYSVRILCHGCPERFEGNRKASGDQVFDPAAIEHKLPGAGFRPDEGWSWDELESVSEEDGGATRAEVDALKLLAVFMQHTDSKPEQQRLVCLDDKHDEKDAKRDGKSEDAKEGQKKAESKREEAKHEKHAANGNEPMPCARPFMYINDLGVTFGKANRTNEGKIGGVNLTLWAKTPVWKSGRSCVGNLPKSATGTLDNPHISEQGRRFLADLLTQLSDQQIHDLFESARVTLRVRDPRDPRSGLPSVDEWVRAFKQKRDDIVNRVCSTT